VLWTVAVSRSKHHAGGHRHRLLAMGHDPGFPILYLGKPTESVTGRGVSTLGRLSRSPSIADHLAPRVRVTAEIEVTEILDGQVR
jgi:hypothetical protein